MKQIILINILLLSVSNIGWSFDKTSKIINKVMPSVVLIANVDKWSGGGVLIQDQETVLTAAHVIKSTDVTNLQVIFYEGYPVIGVKEIISNPYYDLALLKLTKPHNIRPVPLSREKVYVGMYVFTIGHPASLFWTVTDGIISYLKRPMPGSSSVMQSSVIIYGGSSGGPLFNLKGQLVGITRSIWSNGIFPYAGMSFFTSSKDIDNFLRQSKKYNLGQIKNDKLD